MKARFFFLLVVIHTMTACHNDEAQYPVLTLDSNTAVAVSLSWNKIPSAQGYKIWRSFIDPATKIILPPTIIAAVDANTLSFVDTGLPIANSVDYYVTATVGGEEMKSNVINAQGRVLFNLLPYQMALIPERNRAVIRGTNEIVVIDYEQGILFRRLAFPGTIGHFALARYGGNWELYVPCSDGNIYICDAADPVILETIPVGPSLVSAAANSKGWIAVSTTDYYDPVKIYRRQTLTRLNSLNDFNTWSARLFFWSDYSLFAVSAYTSPSMMSLYNLNEQGVFLSETDDPYGYQYEKSVTLVRISDRYVVTSSSGHVFSLPDLTYQNTLSAAGTDQMDFQFSEDGNTIYSSMAIERNLFKSVLSNGKIINTERIPTIGYTWLLARDKDEMVVLSASQPFSKYSTPGSFIIETVALK